MHAYDVISICAPRILSASEKEVNLLFRHQLSKLERRNLLNGEVSVVRRVIQRGDSREVGK